MSSLLHDRFLVIDGLHACDLATGDVVQIDDVTGPDASREPWLPALREVLDHGRDGEPRALVADAGPGTRWKTAAARVAADAVDRGYLPLAVDVLARLRPAVREYTAERAVLLIASDRNAACAQRALIDIASCTAKPHVLLTLRCTRSPGTPHVREARATYAAATRPRSSAPMPPEVVQQLQRARRAPDFVAAGRHAAAERLLRDVVAALLRRRAWSHAVGEALLLARLLLERGRPLDAARVLLDVSAAAAAADDERLDAELRLWLATARIDAGQLTAAESICRALLVAGALPDGPRAWAHALLARVLLWQGRTRDALALPTAADASQLSVETDAFVRATTVRLLLASNRVFEAGLHVQRLLDECASESAIARIIAFTSHLRVLTAVGDLAGAAERLRNIAVSAREARAPLRLLRARVIWLDALWNAGRVREAESELRVLTRLQRAAPPLLRRAIEERRKASSTIAFPPTRTGGAFAQPLIVPADDGSAAALVRAAQDEDDDGTAVRQVLESIASRLHTSRIDIWSVDAGPATIVVAVGSGLASTIGGRVVESGIVIGPEDTDPPRQLGLPVRLGSRFVGALVARWPADRIPPPDSKEILDLAVAVTAPRLDALLHRARMAAEAATLIPELVGVSRSIADVRQAVARGAAAPFAVLVEGESGVGKELIARAVHYMSPRRERRFCDVNCAALPDDLLESELFGHAKGAFTGAVADRAGLFEDAHGGTLFLDEIADLSLRAQAKLLRVLQQQEIRRVGETFARPVDVRLVAAANRDMRVEAAAGRFRQDLLYRLDVIRITVPPLRERPNDVPLLARHFWRTAADRVGTLASLSAGVLSALAAYQWPGNVRELQNVIAALAVAAPRRGQVRADLLPAAISGATPIRCPRLADAREQFERRFVEAALARAGGNRARAARALGLSRQGLLKLMGRLGIGS